MKFKTLVGAVLLATSTVSIANTLEGTVIRVDPVLRNVHSTESVPTIIEQCHDTGRNSMGLIEGATGTIFGSTSGSVGAGLGWLAGDAVGGSGAQREIARGLGTIVGNSVGNTMSNNSRSRQCTLREVFVTRDVVRTISDGFRIRVQAFGSTYVVHRSFAPEIGSRIAIAPQGFN